MRDERERRRGNKSLAVRWSGPCGLCFCASGCSSHPPRLKWWFKRVMITLDLKHPSNLNRRVDSNRFLKSLDLCYIQQWPMSHPPVLIPISTLHGALSYMVLCLSSCLWVVPGWCFLQLWIHVRKSRSWVRFSIHLTRLLREQWVWLGAETRRLP